jgi:hypothetical protein
MPIDITEIRINTASLEYLRERQLIKQYLKAKKFIISWNLQNVDLKLREPQSDGIWYFRINKQYRAHARYEDGILWIFYIDNHSR